MDDEPINHNTRFTIPDFPRPYGCGFAYDGFMAAHNLDPKALARLAIWARFGAPISRRQKWRGFDARETSRLMELASAVDRQTLLRSLGIFIFLVLFSGLFFAGVMGATIVFLSRASYFSFTQLTLLVAAGGFVAAIGALLAYAFAQEAGPPRSLVESLTAQPGDEELIVKVRRLNWWYGGASVVAAVVLLLGLWIFKDTIQPFLDRWIWVAYLLNAVWLVLIPVQIFRRPRPIKPADNTMRADVGAG